LEEFSDAPIIILDGQKSYFLTLFPDISKQAGAPTKARQKQEFTVQLSPFSEVGAAMMPGLQKIRCV
jgi:hypothetical protein